MALRGDNPDNYDLVNPRQPKTIIEQQEVSPATRTIARKADGAAAMPVRPTLPKIDTDWFRGKIADRRTSARQIALKMGIDPAAMSLMLRGQRKMSVVEAAELADHLGEPLEEVVRRAGAAILGGMRTPEQIQDMVRSRGYAVATPVGPRGGGTAGADGDAVLRAMVAGADGQPRMADGTGVAVVGWVDNAGLLHEGKAFGPAVVHRPPGVPMDAQAARLQTQDVWDGWLLFYRPATDVAPEAVGQMCVIELEDGQRKLRFVSRGFEPGQWVIGGGLWPREDGVKLRSAAPVLWMKQR